MWQSRPPQDVSLRVGLRAMLDATRNDEWLALAQLDVAIAQLDRQAPAQHEEKGVGASCLCQTNFP